MANTTPTPSSTEDEVSDAALDAVSGGQGPAVQKMDTITVTASRLPTQTASTQKMDPIVVTASKLPDPAATQLASAGAAGKKKTV